MSQTFLSEPITTMMKEHLVLLSLLGDLGSVLADDSADRGRLEHLLNTFLRNLDAHVHKEEEFLLPLVRAALGTDATALEIIEIEHASVVDLRDRFNCLAACLRQNDASIPNSVRQLTELTRLAADVLPAHIFKEDNVIYPLASHIISPTRFKEMTAEMNGSTHK